MKGIIENLFHLLEWQFTREGTLYLVYIEEGTLLLLGNTGIITYSNVKSLWSPCFSSAPYIHDIRSGHIIGIPMVPLLQIHYYFTMRDFMFSLSDENQSDIIRAFSSLLDN